MTVNELFKLFFEKIDNVDFMISYEKHKPTEPFRKDYWVGYLCGFRNIFSNLIEQCEDYHNPIEIRDENLLKDFSYVDSGVYTELDESMASKLYNNKKVIAGQSYSTTIKPEYLLLLGDRMFPVFYDDPGACYYIHLPKGQNFYSGTLSTFVNEELMYQLFGEYIEYTFPFLFK